MLQQTQVATVIPYFNRFVDRFPDLQSLAQADTADVLRLWQGLGYYSRAGNLQKTAQKVVKDFNGILPRTVDELLTLPGVGRYTAGAIASLAFGRRAPILDGNVTRVLCRLDEIHNDPRDRAVQEILWTRAEEVLPQKRVGDFNSALMELGATICTPRAPQCLLCPVREHCDACAAGIQEKIPPPKKRKPTPLHRRNVFCIRHGDKWLIEQRPEKGRWAGLWQFITINADGGNKLSLPKIVARNSPPRKLGRVTHALTHRRYEFQAFACEALCPIPDTLNPNHRWVTLKELDRFPLSRPQLQIAALL